MDDYYQFETLLDKEAVKNSESTIPWTSDFIRKEIARYTTESSLAPAVSSALNSSSFFSAISEAPAAAIPDESPSFR